MIQNLLKKIFIGATEQTKNHTIKETEKGLVLYTDDNIIFSEDMRLLRLFKTESIVDILEALEKHSSAYFFFFSILRTRYEKRYYKYGAKLYSKNKELDAIFTLYKGLEDNKMNIIDFYFEHAVIGITKVFNDEKKKASDDFKIEKFMFLFILENIEKELKNEEDIMYPLLKKQIIDFNSLLENR